MTADEELRGRLTEALPRAVGPAALRYPPEFGEPDPLTQFGREVLDALLPTVRAAMDRRAAEELRAAAANVYGLPAHEVNRADFVDWLRARADALAGEDGQ